MNEKQSKYKQSDPKIYGLIPPQAIEIEEAILGALMLERDAIHQIESIVSSETFYLERHRIIFDAIKTISKRKEPIDLITVTKHLNDDGQLNEIGGPIYVTQLTSRIVSAAHIEHHARILAQLYVQRQLITIGSEIQVSAYEQGADIEEMLTEIKRKLFEVESVFVNGNDGSLQSDVLEATFIEISDDCENVANGKPIGIPTGIYALGKLIGGFRSTNLIVLAARPGVGKTSLGLHFTTIAAKAGKWVNFYTMEMGKNDLQRIVLSGQTGVNRTSLRDGYLTDLDWSKLNERSNELSKLPIVWYDTPVTVEAITAKTIKNKRLNRCDMIVIDYLGLIKASDKRVNREQQVSNITASLKGLALEMKIPIILLSQLNREASNRKPILSDLRESGAIEQDADVVLFPYRDEAAGTYSIIIGKNRRGKCCEFEIFANDEMTVFGNLDNPPQLQQMIATETTLADEKYQMNPNRNFESESSPF